MPNPSQTLCMINRQLTFNPTEPIVVGYMAVVYSEDKEGKVVIWHKSKVVTDQSDADLIVGQWKQQLGYGPGTGEVKYGTPAVYLKTI